MFHLLPILKVIAAVAGIYAGLFVLSAQIFGLDAAAAFRVSSIIELILLVFCLWGWRKVWSTIPMLNRWFFPDLNGKWDANIAWIWGEKQGLAQGKVYIKQDFFTISIEVITENSESSTLSVLAKKDPESKRPLLYYVYECESKHVSDVSPKYKGAAVLKLALTDNNRLEGNYFTSRSTNGHFIFRRIDTEVD